VVITGLGAVGSVNFYATAALGFGSGTEWRVQIRPIFANGVVGDYGTDYQCVKMRGIAAAAPLESADEISKSIDQRALRDIEIWPNPGTTGEIHLRWGHEGLATILIWDSAGRIVSQKEWSNQDKNQEFIIYPNHLTKGLYFVEVRSEDSISRKRWMKL